MIPAWLFAVGIALLAIVAAAQAVENNNIKTGSTSTCSKTDLDRSHLVQCSSTNCTIPAGPDHPAPGQIGPEKVMLVRSSRAGDRFVVEWLPRLHFKESEEQRLLDINTTIEVSLSESAHVFPFGGLGAALDVRTLLSKLDTGEAREMYFHMFGDMFRYSGQSPGLGLEYMVLEFSDREQIDAKQLEMLLVTIDRMMHGQIKVVMNLAALTVSGTDLSDVTARFKIIKPQLRFLQLAFVVMNCRDFDLESKPNHDEPTSNDVFLLCTDEMYNLDGANYMTKIGEETFGELIFAGWYVESNDVTVNNVLQKLKILSASTSQFTPIYFTVGRDRSRFENSGDWQSAQIYAAEILSHLKLNSFCYIDKVPLVNLADKHDPEVLQNAPLYNLRPSESVHFRSPLFYAMGHFSRFLDGGMMTVRHTLKTQPNMFAGYYGTFSSTVGNRRVVVVLNDNEHMMPFRVSWNGYIEMQSDLQPKSFNTIIFEG